MEATHIFDAGGINWTWVIFAHVASDGVHILKYERYHKDRDECPETMGYARLVENENRYVTHIDIGWDKPTRYVVLNTKHVFDYR